MKVIAILEVDPETVLQAAYGDDHNDPETTVEGAVEFELNWAAESVIAVKEVIAEDSIPPNDADLGEEIRKHLI